MICLKCNVGEMRVPASGHKSYLICPTCGCIELTYEPQEYQEAFHEAPYTYTYNPRTGKEDIDIQVIGVFGGYGSGKSRASLTEVVLRALENPGGTGLLTAPTLLQLKRTTIKTLFNEVLPPPLVENYNKSEGEIKLINGFTFWTVPSDDEDKIRSINAGIVHMEEASGIDRTIYDQILTRMRDPFVKNRLFCVCSNPDVGWINEVIYRNKDRADKWHPEHDAYNRFITCHIWETSLNKYLPPDFIELQSKGKPEWWIKRYLKGSMEHTEGAVYPNFSSCLLTREEYLLRLGKPDIPKHWERFVNLDHGLRNPTAVYISAIDPERGEVVTYKEYYKPNTLIPEHAKALKPMIGEIAAGTLRFMVADPSIRNKTDPINGKSVQALYQEYELFFTEGNNNVEAGILRVNSYIERKKWIILRDECPNLVREGINYKYPELSMDEIGENLDERPEKKNDHAMDSMRYGFMRLPDDPALLLTVGASPPDRYRGKRYAVDDDDDEDEGSYNSGSNYMNYGY